jgi:hypothetical protein
MDSRPYRFYVQFLYPVERWICGLWPGLLAFQFVVLARPVSLARLNEGTSVDRVPGDLAALEALSTK